MSSRKHILSTIYILSILFETCRAGYWPIATDPKVSSNYGVWESGYAGGLVFEKFHVGIDVVGPENTTCKTLVRCKFVFYDVEELILYLYAINSDNQLTGTIYQYGHVRELSRPSDGQIFEAGVSLPYSVSNAGFAGVSHEHMHLNIYNTSTGQTIMYNPLTRSELSTKDPLDNDPVVGPFLMKDMNRTTSSNTYYFQYNGFSLPKITGKVKPICQIYDDMGKVNVGDPFSDVNVWGENKNRFNGITAVPRKVEYEIKNAFGKKCVSGMYEFADGVEDNELAKVLYDNSKYSYDNYIKYRLCFDLSNLGTPKVDGIYQDRYWNTKLKNGQNWDGISADNYKDAKYTDGYYTIEVKATDADGNDRVSSTNVLVDNFSPEVEEVTRTWKQGFDVVFSEPVDPVTAAQASNYSILGAVSINGAVLDPNNNRVVRVTTSNNMTNAIYDLTVSNIKDLAGNPLAVSTISFKGSSANSPIWYQKVYSFFFGKGDPQLRNGIIQRGDSVVLYTAIKNYTFGDLSNLSGSLSSITAGVNLCAAIQQFNSGANISPEEVAVNRKPFVFKVPNNISSSPASLDMKLEVNGNSSSGPFKDVNDFLFPVGFEIVTRNGDVIIDDSRSISGFNDEDGIIDAGEKIALYVNLNNTTGSDLKNVSANLLPGSNEYVEVLEGSQNYGYIEALQNFSNTKPFIVSVSNNVTHDTTLPLILSLKSWVVYNDKEYWETKIININIFALHSGEPPTVAVRNLGKFSPNGDGYKDLLGILFKPDIDWHNHIFGKRVRFGRWAEKNCDWYCPGGPYYYHEWLQLYACAGLEQVHYWDGVVSKPVNFWSDPTRNLEDGNYDNNYLMVYRLFSDNPWPIGDSWEWFSFCDTFAYAFSIDRCSQTLLSPIQLSCNTFSSVNGDSVGFTFNLSEPCIVSLKVVNTTTFDTIQYYPQGSLVNPYVLRAMHPVGRNTIYWNGKDVFGDILSTGLYKCILTIDDDANAPLDYVVFVQLDNTGPFIHINSPLRKRSFKSGRIVYIESFLHDPANGVRSAEVSIKDPLTNQFNPLASSSVHILNDTLIKAQYVLADNEGRYELKIKAIDNAGPIGNSFETYRTFFGDDTPPNLKIYDTDPNGYNIWSPRATATMPVAFIIRDNLDSVIFKPDQTILQIAKIDGDVIWSKIIDCQYGVDQWIKWDFLNNNGDTCLVDGKYVVKIKSVDQAGNLSFAIDTITIDISAPIVTVNRLMDTLFTSNQDSIYFQYYTNEKAFIVFNYIDTLTNDTLRKFGIADSGKMCSFVEGAGILGEYIKDGVYEIQAVACDIAGNRSIIPNVLPVGCYLRIDRTKPAILQASCQPWMVGNNNITNLSFKVSEKYDRDCNFSRLTIKATINDSIVFNTIDSIGSGILDFSVPVDLTFLLYGTYDISIEATDTWGNRGEIFAQAVKGSFGTHIVTPTGHVSRGIVAVTGRASDPNIYNQNPFMKYELFYGFSDETNPAIKANIDHINWSSQGIEVPMYRREPGGPLNRSIKEAENVSLLGYWNTKTLNGDYYLKLLSYESGTNRIDTSIISVNVAEDTILPPLITDIVLTPPNSFAIQEDSRLEISYALAQRPANVSIDIVDPRGRCIFHQKQYGVIPGDSAQTKAWWNGKNTNGNNVLGGEYLVKVSAEGVDGDGYDVRQAPILVISDMSIDSVEIEPTVLYPNYGQPGFTPVTLKYRVNVNSYITVEVYKQDSLITILASKTPVSGNWNQTISWDGNSGSEIVKPGKEYRFKIIALSYDSLQQIVCWSNEFTVSDPVPVTTGDFYIPGRYYQGQLYRDSVYCGKGEFFWDVTADGKYYPPQKYTYAISAKAWRTRDISWRVNVNATEKWNQTTCSKTAYAYSDGDYWSRDSKNDYPIIKYAQKVEFDYYTFTRTDWLCAAAASASFRSINKNEGNDGKGSGTSYISVNPGTYVVNASASACGYEYFIGHGVAEAKAISTVIYNIGGRQEYHEALYNGSSIISGNQIVPVCEDEYFELRPFDNPLHYDEISYRYTLNVTIDGITRSIITSPTTTASVTINGVTVKIDPTSTPHGTIWISSDTNSVYSKWAPLAYVSDSCLYSETVGNYPINRVAVSSLPGFGDPPANAIPPINYYGPTKLSGSEYVTVGQETIGGQLYAVAAVNGWDSLWNTQMDQKLVSTNGHISSDQPLIFSQGVFNPTGTWTENAVIAQKYRGDTLQKDVNWSVQTQATIAQNCVDTIDAVNSWQSPYWGIAQFINPYLPGDIIELWPDSGSSYIQVKRLFKAKGEDWHWYWCIKDINSGVIVYYDLPGSKDKSCLPIRIDFYAFDQYWDYTSYGTMSIREGTVSNTAWSDSIPANSIITYRQTIYSISVDSQTATDTVLGDIGAVINCGRTQMRFGEANGSFSFALTGNLLDNYTSTFWDFGHASNPILNIQNWDIALKYINGALNADLTCDTTSTGITAPLIYKHGYGNGAKDYFKPLLKLTDKPAEFLEIRGISDGKYYRLYAFDGKTMEEITDGMMPPVLVDGPLAYWNTNDHCGIYNIIMAECELNDPNTPVAIKTKRVRIGNLYQPANNLLSAYDPYYRTQVQFGSAAFTDTTVKVCPVYINEAGLSGEAPYIGGNIGPILILKPRGAKFTLGQRPTLSYRYTQNEQQRYNIDTTDINLFVVSEDGDIDALPTVFTVDNDNLLTLWSTADAFPGDGEHSIFASLDSSETVLGKPKILGALSMTGDSVALIEGQANPFQDLLIMVTDPANDIYSATNAYRKRIAMEGRNTAAKSKVLPGGLNCNLVDTFITSADAQGHFASTVNLFPGENRIFVGDKEVLEYALANDIKTSAKGIPVKKNCPIGFRSITRDTICPRVVITGDSMPKINIAISAASLTFFSTKPGRVYYARFNGNNTVADFRPFDVLGFDTISVAWDGCENGVPVIDGRYKYLLFAIDKVGNRSADVNGFWVIDRNPPQIINLTVAPNPFAPRSGQTTTFNYILSDTASARLEISSPAGEIVLSQNMGDCIAGSNSYIWNGHHQNGDTVVNDGMYIFSIYAQDQGGNATVSSGSIQVVTDITPPVTTIMFGAPHYGVLPTYIGPATSISLSASDDISGIDSTVFRIDAGAWVRYFGSFTIAAEGSHIVSYKSVDKLGNWEMENNYSVAVDLTPPASQIAAGLPQHYANGQLYISSSTSLSIAAQDLATNGVASGVKTIQYKIDNGNWQSYSGPFTIIGIDGQHVVQYRAFDNVDNQETINNLVIILDNTPPATIVDIGNPNHTVGTMQYVTRQTPIQLSITDNGAGIATAEYSVDSSDWLPYSQTVEVHLESEGSHVLRWRSTDQMGNAEAEGMLQLVVDNTPPVSTVSIGEPQYPGMGTVYLTSATAITMSALDSLGAGISDIQYRLNNGEWATYSIPFTITGTDGGYLLEFRAIDELGNAEPARSMQLTLDNKPPQSNLVVGSPSHGLDPVYISQLTNLTLNSEDGQGSGLANLEYTIDNGPWTMCAPGFVFQITQEGLHNLAFRGSDNLGNIETSSLRSLAVDNTPPSCNHTVGTPTVHVNGHTYVTNLTPVAIWGKDSLNHGVASGMQKIEWLLNGVQHSENDSLAGIVLNGPDGQYNISCQATDWVENKSQVRNLELWLDNTPPATTIDIGDPKYNAGIVYITSSSIIRLTVYDNGCGVGQSEYSIDNGSWVSYNQTTGFSLPSEGLHDISWRSRDLLGNAEPEQNIEVAVDNTPSISSLIIGQPQFVFGQQDSTLVSSRTDLTILAYDPVSSGVACGVGKAEYRIDAGEWNSRPDSTMSFNLTGEDRLYHIEHRSADHLGNLETAKTVFVVLDNTPPQALITSPAGLIYLYGNVTITGTAADLHFSRYYLDYGVGSNPATWNRIGTIHQQQVVNNVLDYWDVVNLPQGHYTLRLTVVDAVENTSICKVNVFIGQPHYAFEIDGFNKCEGVALDAAGNIYVAERNASSNQQHNRVAKFDPFGTLLLNIYDVRKPNGVDVDESGFIYATEWAGDRMTKFNQNGDSVSSIGGFNKPNGVAVDKTGNIYIADQNNNRIVKYNGLGNHILTISGLNHPEGVAVDSSNNIYTTDTQNGKVNKYNQLGQLVMQFGAFGSLPGQFNQPSDIELDMYRNIWVVDRNNDRIQAFDPSGNILMYFGASGNGSGQFNKPEGIALDDALSIYVADRNNDRVQKFVMPTEAMLAAKSLMRNSLSNLEPLRIQQAISWPNPFNPVRETAKLRVEVNKDASMEVCIYSLTGRLVCRKEASLIRGINESDWDGRNGIGEMVNNGVYNYVVTAKAGDEKATAQGKIVVMK